MKTSTNVQKIDCPHCGKEIPLSEVLTKQIEESIKSEYEALLKRKETDFAVQLQQERDTVKEQAIKQAQDAASGEIEELKVQLNNKSLQLTESKKREMELTIRQQELDEKERTIGVEVQKQILVEKNKIIESTKANLNVELADLRSQLQERDQKLKESEEAELSLRKKERELDEWEKKIVTDAKKQLESEKEKIVETAKAEAQIELRDMQSQLAENNKKLADAQKAELELRKRQRDIEEREKNIGVEVKKQLESEKIKIIEGAKADTQLELKDLQSRIEEKEKKLAEAQKAELELRKRQREIEEREAQLSLEVERRIGEERKSVAEHTRLQLEEDFKLKGKEKDIVIDGLKKQIGELQRKAEQGSNQIQGEAQEVELYDILNQAFRYDNIERIRKGKEGADDLMQVKDSLGNICGSILIESKRTKTWVDGWIDKAKDDQREAKANIMVIVSKILPKEIQHIGNKEGVWICDLQSAMGLILVLREGVLQISEARSALAGKSEKMDMMYDYLSGAQFKQRVEAIVEGFTSMQEGLEKEKRSMASIWAQREKEIEKVIKNTSNLYGELKGIIGRALPEVKALELPAAATVEEKEDDLPF